MFKIPLFVFASILQCLTFVYKISMRKKETPRCHPQGHNARGLPPAWLNEARLTTEPKLVTTLKGYGLRVLRRCRSEEGDFFDF